MSFERPGFQRESHEPFLRSIALARPAPRLRAAHRPVPARPHRDRPRLDDVRLLLHLLARAPRRLRAHDRAVPALGGGGDAALERDLAPRREAHDLRARRGLVGRLAAVPARRDARVAARVDLRRRRDRRHRLRGGRHDPVVDARRGGGRGRAALGPPPRGPLLRPVHLPAQARRGRGRRARRSSCSSSRATSRTSRRARPRSPRSACSPRWCRACSSCSARGWRSAIR